MQLATDGAQKSFAGPLDPEIHREVVEHGSVHEGNLVEAPRQVKFKVAGRFVFARLSQHPQHKVVLPSCIKFSVPRELLSHILTLLESFRRTLLIALVLELLLVFIEDVHG